MDGPLASHDAPSRRERAARALASPAGILILVPVLVLGAGIVVLLLARRATRDANDTMARDQLSVQAADVARDVAFALDQADPMLARLRALADPALPIAEVAPRMHDLMVGRPGVTNVSIGFPSGVMRGTFIPPHAPRELHVQESVRGATETHRTNYQVIAGGLHATNTLVTDYDVRTRDHYRLAVATGRRTWTPPRVYFTSHTTGITCVEPVYAADGALRAVITVDFDVAALSKFLARSPLPGARSVVFAKDGTILAFPSVPVPQIAIDANRLVRHADYDDPALTALFAAVAAQEVTAQRFLSLAARDGAYLASVAPVGGRRAGISTPLDWYLAALVPERTLLGPTRLLERRSLLASGGALSLAMGVALMLAWNLVRMRRDVKAARARTRSAEATIQELGAYRLLDRLGAGGMGEVWRAEHRLLARKAAVKLVRREALTDPLHGRKARERFRREAQTLASMRSRHTIELFDYGVTDDGTFFFVMELLDGLDLDRLVRIDGPQPAARVIDLLVQACQSLAEAHDAGLLHRDIKPANLFVCRAADEVDIVKVLDFGIVHRIGDPAADPLEAVSLPPTTAPLLPSSKLTQDGAVVGTPGYIPPENVLGRRPDARSDLYALACVAWWLLTASEVHARASGDAALRAHVHEPTPSLRRRVRGWLPDELEAIIARCLEKDPEQRPTDARALARALRAIPIPAEHAWTEADARAWWDAHATAGRATSVADPDATRTGQRVLMTNAERAWSEGPPSTAAPTVRER